MDEILSDPFYWTNTALTSKQDKVQERNYGTNKWRYLNFK